MKIQKVSSRVYGKKEYYKYIIVLPTKDVEKANLKEGDELSSEIKDKEIILKKK